MGASLSVVMICRNNPEILTSIEVVLKQLGEHDELFIVDDCSELPYREQLASLQEQGLLTLIESDRVGNRSHNRNLGAAAASGDWLVFQDGDMVMCDNNLRCLREACRTSAASAFVGHVHAMTYCESATMLYAGIDNFVELVRTPRGRKELSDNPLFEDKRNIAKDREGRYKDYYWLNFYSAVCIVRRDVFDELDGFAEFYEGWGCEDIDLGFRIDRAGYGIGFLERFHSIHVPHRRNVLRAERSNLANMQRAIAAYRCWEWEVAATFRSAFNAVIAVDRMIKSMRLLDLPALAIEDAGSTMYIEPVSRANPNGRVTMFGRRGGRTDLEMLGLALPNTEEGFFQTCYVNSGIYVYPPVLASEILREATRVAENVLIVDTGDRTRVNWTPLIGNFGFARRSRNDHFFHDIMEYSYAQDRNLLRVEHQRLD